MSNNTELIDKESLDKIVADIKAILKRTSLDALNSVQWEFNQRYLFGNEVDKPLIKSGKLFTKEGPVAKGAIWTSLDTGKLWMNTGSGWKNIGGLNNINKPDLIEVFHPRTDYPVETPYTTTDAGGEFWVPFKFKKYEKYSITKGQTPFTGFLTRTSNSRTDIAQDVRTSFSSGPGTYEFICMVDDAKYFYFTTGSSSNTTDLTLTDLGSAIEPVKISNMTETNRFVTFPIEKGKRYYYTKTARSFYIGYGKGSKSVQNPDNRLKQVNNSGDSGAGTWSFVAEHDADWLYIFIGPDAVLESFEFRGEDLPDYKLTYPYVTRSANDRPESPKVGDMIFDSYQAGTSGSPLWWNGTNWVDAKASASMLATTDAPVTANNGAVYYDTTEQNLKIYSGGEWKTAVNYPIRAVLDRDNQLPIEGALRFSASPSSGTLVVYANGSWRNLTGTTAVAITSYTGETLPTGASGYIRIFQNSIIYYTSNQWWKVYARPYDGTENQVITFTDSSGETITAADKKQIIVTASFGSVSILDLSNITKEEGKTIEINILASSIIRVKDGATEKDLTDCSESIVKAICLSNVWHFYKVSGITEIV